MRRDGRRGRLFLRLSLLVLCLIGLAISVPSAWTMLHERQILREKLQSRAIATARTVALASSDACVAGDEDSLVRTVVTLVHEDHEVSQALIADREGKAIAHSRSELWGTLVPDLNPPQRTASVREVTTEDGHKAFQVTAPILVSGEPWGSFRAELPLAPLEEELRVAALRVVAVGAILLALGAAAAGWFARSIARPVERLAAAATEVARGNFSVRSGLRSHDEIGALAESFDSMTAGLADASARLRQYSTSLEAMVEKRTEELEEKTREVAKARDEALKAARVKAEFLANMSHETRTPLNGVIGLAELLVHTELNAEQRELAETIHSSAQALLTILNDILDFSKIEAGKLQLESVDLDVRTVAEDVSDLLAEQARKKGIELVCAAPGRIPSALVGDPVRLRQILLNLMGNAVKFTEDGEVVVRVSCEEEKEGSALLRFEVSDTGPGISEEGQRRLFQSFSQVDGSSARKHGGTGLGLAISKQLTELMGGAIGVRSEPGKGSTFFWLSRGSAEGCSRAPTGSGP